MKIGINCGHTVSGQPGCGAVGFIDESIETRKVGKALMNLFRNGGHTVVDCTNDYASSTSANLASIVMLANRQPLDLFVSIHFNAGGGRGTEVYTYGGQKLAEAVNACNKIAALGFNNRGVKDGSSLYVVKRTNAKAMLIEVCFVDTDDADKYRKLGCQKIAEAIYSAITGTSGTISSITGTAVEYTKINDIIGELGSRGILSNTSLWLQKCNEDTNIYWFCRKLCQYVRTKKGGETADREYTDIGEIIWDLHYRGIITDKQLWTDYMNRDSNVYWLLRKGLHYCRTH